MKRVINENESELCHAFALKELLRNKRSYIYQECLTLLMLASRVVETSYDEQEEAINKLEEFLR